MSQHCPSPDRCKAAGFCIHNLFNNAPGIGLPPMPGLLGLLLDTILGPTLEPEVKMTKVGEFVTTHTITSKRGSNVRIHGVTMELFRTEPQFQGDESGYMLVMSKASTKAVRDAEEYIRQSEG